MEHSEVLESLFLVLAVLIGIPLLIIRMFLGKRGFEIFKGEWVFEITRFLVTAPFKFIIYLWKVIFEAFVRWKTQSSLSGGTFAQFLKKLF